MKDEQTRYKAPALDRGPDILELLATRGSPISQAKIAAELNRSSSEVFRMLSCLVDRGYVSRSGDGFLMTMRIRQMADNWPLSRILLKR